MFRPALLPWILLAAMLAGCATTANGPEPMALANVTPFSGAAPGGALPGGWRVWQIARFKKPTRYDLIHKDGSTVVLARADNSASALLHPLANLDAARGGGWRRGEISEIVGARSTGRTSCSRERSS